MGRGADARSALAFGLAGAIVGGAAGVGAGLARGSVDSVTGTGVGPALAQTGAAVVGGAVAGVGGLFLADAMPFAREATRSGAGMGVLLCAFLGAGALAASVVAPPIMDKLGWVD